MQPVLEFVKRHARSYTYTIRAPRMGGVIPVACYIDRGHVSLAACLFDAAQALSVNFPRVYVRYQGVCMGEFDGEQLARFAEPIARQWMLADENRHEAGFQLPAFAAAEARDGTEP